MGPHGDPLWPRWLFPLHFFDSVRIGLLNQSPQPRQRLSTPIAWHLNYDVYLLGGRLVFHTHLFLYGCYSNRTSRAGARPVEGISFCPAGLSPRSRRPRLPVMSPEGIRAGRPGPPRAVLIAVSRHSVYARAFSEEELQALTDLCRLAEEELADIELTRLLKPNIGIQARVRAVMDATSEGILLIGRGRGMG